jgi:hypothetical protein
MRHQKHFLLDRFLQSYQLSQRVVNATTDFLKMNFLQKLLSLFIAITQKVKYMIATILAKKTGKHFRHFRPFWQRGGLKMLKELNVLLLS